MRRKMRSDHGQSKWCVVKRVHPEALQASAGRCVLKAAVLGIFCVCSGHCLFPVHGFEPVCVLMGFPHEVWSEEM